MNLVENEILAAAFVVAADGITLRMFVDREYARHVMSRWSGWLRSNELLRDDRRDRR